MSFLVAMAQMSPRLGDVRGNVERHLQIIEEARAKRADVLLFPELSLTGVALGDRAVDVSLTLDSPEFADVRRASKELAIGIGLIERTTDRLLRNSYLWLDGGTVLQLHRKVHLGETAAGHEASVLAPGRRFRAIDTRRGRVGILTGADARHLTAASVLALDGLDVLVAPLALPARPPRGAAARGRPLGLGAGVRLAAPVLRLRRQPRRGRGGRVLRGREPRVRPHRGSPRGGRRRG
jgi:NAD+ synthase (glutamine-hydrolysing)